MKTSKITRTNKGVITQSEINENEWLTIDVAKDETLEAVKQIFDVDDWSAEEQVRLLCPNGVMTLEEFRWIGHEMIDELYDELEKEENE